jgi:hypothetical protein
MLTPRRAYLMMLDAAAQHGSSENECQEVRQLWEPMKESKLPQISGSGCLMSGPATLAPATPPHTYLGVASAIMPAVRLLAGTPEAGGIPHSLLSAHALECLLKAYLSRKGVYAPLT